MAKSDNEFINTSQIHELNDWLDRNSYRETRENRDELRDIILGLKRGNSSNNLTWKELDDARANQPSKFKNLEKK